MKCAQVAIEKLDMLAYSSVGLLLDNKLDTSRLLSDLGRMVLQERNVTKVCEDLLIAGPERVENNVIGLPTNLAAISVLIHPNQRMFTSFKNPVVRTMVSRQYSQLVPIDEAIVIHRAQQVVFKLADCSEVIPDGSRSIVRVAVGLHRSKQGKIYTTRLYW